MGAEPLRFERDPAALPTAGLSAPVPWPTSGPRWWAAAARIPGIEPLFAVLDDVALAPLARRRGMPFRLETLGARELYEPTDVLARDDEARAELLGRLCRRVPLLLPSLPLEGPTLPALRRAVRGRAAVVVGSRYAVPVLELHEGWSDPESQLAPRRRQDLRRARRRAGEIEVELAAGDVDLALEIEGRGWKGDAGTALLRDPVRLPFYRAYAAAAAADGVLRVAILRIEGRPAAMQLMVEEARALWLLKIGFDSAFARCSPGQILLGETIADAARRGLERCEFLGAAADWTRVWTGLERPCGTVAVYPFSPRSLPALAGDAARRLRR